MSWWDRAACLDRDTELFFPVGTAGPALLQAAEAKQVCAGCPVRDDCLVWAVKVGAEHGVWGGLSEEERRSRKRRQTRARAKHVHTPISVRVVPAAAEQPVHASV